MAERVCKWCKYIESLQNRNLEEELQRYITDMPEELKASDSVLSERLELCGACEFCYQGICRFCGCYVAVCAAKKGMYCPNPGKPKWKQSETDEIGSGRKGEKQK